MNIKLSVKKESPVVLSVHCGGVIPAGEVYPGPYEVTPAVRQQVLNTRNKQMSDDVTVLEIPYAETSNESGTTAIIAS